MIPGKQHNPKINSYQKIKSGSIPMCLTIETKLTARPIPMCLTRETKLTARPIQMLNEKCLTEKILQYKHISR